LSGDNPWAETDDEKIARTEKTERYTVLSILFAPYESIKTSIYLI
jgi:hypothetical protein